MAAYSGRGGERRRKGQVAAPDAAKQVTFSERVEEIERAAGELKYFDEDSWMKKHLPSMETTKIKPVVGEVFPADQVAEAHKTLEQKKAKGKVVIRW